MQILGTGYAAVGYGHLTQTDIKGSASFTAVADEALAGMVNQHQLKGGAAHIVNRGRLYLDDHAINGWGGAGGEQPAHLFDFDNAQAAATIRFEVGVVAEGGDIDAGALSCLQDCHRVIGCNLLAIDG